MKRKKLLLLRGELFRVLQTVRKRNEANVNKNVSRTLLYLLNDLLGLAKSAML
jgi:hypothetical protein